MKAFVTAIAMLLTAASWAKDDPKYSVLEIPEELKKDVNLIFRDNKKVISIFAKNRMTLYHYQAITILNEKGKRYAEEVIGYNKLSKVSFFRGTAYDALGYPIKKLKTSEIYDQSAFDGFSLYSDYRLKAADLSQVAYPYTVEFEYEIEYKYLYGIEGMVLIPNEKISVQQASYRLNYLPDLAPRYRLRNIALEPVKETVDGMESLVWTFKNLKPIKFEPLGPSTEDLIPEIYAAPSKFEYEGYAGDMTSWESYGQWEITLNQGRDNLPEPTKQKVKELTQNLNSVEDKARVLYEFMQSKTRYVSIQLGIGGLQPFEASLVDQVGYGDCKALSNYMVALLKEAGIKSYYSTIKAGDFEYDLMLDFPSHQGNHVVVAVPNDQDTIWLECTSQTKAFGYAGMFTGDRKSFMLTENGGIWANTPRYTAETNVKSRTADVFVDLAGNAKAKIKTSYSGLQYENSGLDQAVTLQNDQQKKWIQEHVDIPAFDIDRFSMKNIKSRNPVAVIDLDLTLNRYASVSGKRIFLVPNLMNRSTFVPEKVESRKTKVVKRIAFTDHDTIRYHLPEGIYPEFLPEPVKINSRFGEYEANFKVDGEGLIYIRKMSMKKGEFPPESYTELIDFYRGVSKADNTKLVFMSKT